MLPTAAINSLAVAYGDMLSANQCLTENGENQFATTIAARLINAITSQTLGACYVDNRFYGGCLRAFGHGRYVIEDNGHMRWHAAAMPDTQLRTWVYQNVIEPIARFWANSGECEHWRGTGDYRLTAEYAAILYSADTLAGSAITDWWHSFSNHNEWALVSPRLPTHLSNHPQLSGYAWLRELAAAVNRSFEANNNCLDSYQQTQGALPAFGSPLTAFGCVQGLRLAESVGPTQPANITVDRYSEEILGQELNGATIRAAGRYYALGGAVGRTRPRLDRLSRYEVTLFPVSPPQTEALRDTYEFVQVARVYAIHAAERTALVDLRLGYVPELTRMYGRRFRGMAEAAREREGEHSNFANMSFHIMPHEVLFLADSTDGGLLRCVISFDTPAERRERPARNAAMFDGVRTTGPANAEVAYVNITLAAGGTGTVLASDNAGRLEWRNAPTEPQGLVSPEHRRLVQEYQMRIEPTPRIGEFMFTYLVPASVAENDTQRDGAPLPAMGETACRRYGGTMIVVPGTDRIATISDVRAEYDVLQRHSVITMMVVECNDNQTVAGRICTPLQNWIWATALTHGHMADASVDQTQGWLRRAGQQIAASIEREMLLPVGQRPKPADSGPKPRRMLAIDE